MAEEHPPSDPVPPRVCCGCWREEPLAPSPVAPELLLCAQCLALSATWFRHGAGSEDSRFGRRMIEVWRGGQGPREAYERARAPRTSP